MKKLNPEQQLALRRSIAALEAALAALDEFLATVRSGVVA